MVTIVILRNEPMTFRPRAIVTYPDVSHMSQKFGIFMHDPKTDVSVILLSEGRTAQCYPSANKGCPKGRTVL